MKASHEIIEVSLRLLNAGLVSGTSGNISTRCPNGESIVITPSACDYRLLTEQDLVRVHLASTKAEGQRRPSSEWQLHLAIYQARPNVNAIIHHHGTWSTMVAVARKTIPVLVDEAADIGSIPTVSYALSGSRELAEAASKELTKGSNVVLLANHGAVAVGQDLGEALDRALQGERLAQIYIGAEILGGACPLDEDMVIESQKFLQGYRATRSKSQDVILPAHRLVRSVRIHDLVSYGFHAGLTFTILVHDFILQKLRG